MKTTILAIILALTSVQALAWDDDDAVDFRTTRNSPHLYAPDGTYLGNLNNNRFDPNSISNEFGKYGNRFSSKSVNNPFSQYGNPYSQQYSNPYVPRRW